MIDGDFLKFKLRDVIELVVVVAGVIIYVVSGFGKSHEDSSVTARDLAELSKTMITMASTVHDMDVNGTRGNEARLQIMNKDTTDNTRRIEVLEKNYSALIDILNEIKVQIGGMTKKER